MAKNEGQRCITSLFQTISSEEGMQIVERELAQMRDNNKDATSCSVQKEKHPIGKPRIQHNARILSEHEIKKKIMKARGLQNIKRKEGHIKIGFNHIFGPKY
jgi:hypothetical protein